MPISINGSGPIDGITSLNTTVSNTELGYLDGTTSAIQTQLGSKADILSNGSWTSYTPTITGFTVGNGSISGRYTQIGKTVIFRATFTVGSTSARPNGSVYVNISRPPVPIADEANYQSYMNCMVLDDGTGWFPLISFGDSIWAFGTGGTYAGIAYLSSTIPITWATNDKIFVSGTYEAA